MNSSLSFQSSSQCSSAFCFAEFILTAVILLRCKQMFLMVDPRNGHRRIHRQGRYILLVLRLRLGRCALDFFFFHLNWMRSELKLILVDNSTVLKYVFSVKNCFLSHISQPGSSTDKKGAFLKKPLPFNRSSLNEVSPHCTQIYTFF